MHGVCPHRANCDGGIWEDLMLDFEARFQHVGGLEIGAHETEIRCGTDTKPSAIYGKDIGKRRCLHVRRQAAIKAGTGAGLP